MKVSILQSNYLPWRGYFDIIANSDVCVFLDSVQYTKNDWRNRNRIRGKDGSVRWQSIPVGKSISRRIDEVELPTSGWQENHLAVFAEAYSGTPYFEIVDQTLKAHLEAERRSLSKLNQALIADITREFFSKDVSFLSDTEIKNSGEEENATARLVSVLKSLEADTYLSGPAARAYLNQSMLLDAGIQTKFADYSVYRGYSQGEADFVDGLSIVDLLCWEGHAARKHLAYGRLFQE